MANPAVKIPFAEPEFLEFSPTCAHCYAAKTDHEHRADDAGCGSRAALIAHQLAKREAAKKKKIPAFQPQQQKWPEPGQRLNGPRNPQPQEKFNYKVKPKSTTNPQPIRQKPVQNNRSYADAAKSDGEARGTRAEGQLFSLDELMTLMIDAIDDIEGCSSPLQQLKVIANLIKKCL